MLFAPVPHKLGIAALLLPFALLLVVPAARAQTVHTLTLQLDTTADWVKLELQGFAIQVVSRQLSAGSGLEVSSKGLALNKASWDATPVTLRAELRLTPTGDKPQLAITRGLLGQARVQLLIGKRAVFDVTQKDATKLPNNLSVHPLELTKILASKPLPRHDFGQKLLAFYYGWYGRQDGPTKEWRHWDPQHPEKTSAHTPTLGQYDSEDPKIVQQQINLAKQAGIDGFVLSWWHGDPHHEAVLKALLDAAGDDFAVSLYLESAATPEILRAQVQEILKKYGQHKAWLTAGGKPVLFLYTRIVHSLKAGGLRQALRDTGGFFIGDELEPDTLDVMEGAHQYVSASVPDRYRQELLDSLMAARLRDKLACATVMPGYDDTHVRTPGSIDHREDGDFYSSLWAASRLADWILITSWNEWHEGSEIEPSKEFGDSYLKGTRAFVKRWKR